MVQLRVPIERVREIPLPGSKYSAGASAASFGANNASGMEEVGRALQGASRTMNSMALHDKREAEREERRLQKEAEAAAKKAEGEAKKAANRAASMRHAEFKVNLSEYNLDEAIEDEGLTEYIGDEAFSNANIDYIMDEGNTEPSMSGSGYTAANNAIVYNGWSPSEEESRFRQLITEKRRHFQESLKAYNLSPTAAANEIARFNNQTRKMIVGWQSNQKKKKNTRIQNGLISNMNRSLDDLRGSVYSDAPLDEDTIELIDRSIMDYAEDTKSHIMFEKGYTEEDERLSQNDAIAEMSPKLQDMVEDVLKTGDFAKAKIIAGKVNRYLDNDSRNYLNTKFREEEKRISQEGIIASAVSLYATGNSEAYDKLYESQPLEIQKLIDPAVDLQQEHAKEQQAIIDQKVETIRQENIRQGKVTELIKLNDGSTAQLKPDELLSDEQTAVNYNSIRETPENTTLTRELISMPLDDLAKVTRTDDRLTGLTNSQYDKVITEADSARKQVIELNNEAVAFYTNKNNKNKLDNVFSKTDILPEDRAEIVRKAIDDIRTNGTGAIDLPSVKLWIQQEYVFKYPYKVIENKEVLKYSPEELRMMKTGEMKVPGAFENIYTITPSYTEKEMTRDDIAEYRNMHQSGKKGEYVEDKDITRELMKKLEERGFATTQVNIRFDPRDGSYKFKDTAEKPHIVTWDYNSAGEPVFKYKKAAKNRKKRYGINRTADRKHS